MAINRYKIRNKKNLPISEQDKLIRSLYPQFKLIRRSLDEAVWEGELQPDLEMRKHKIVIEYRIGTYPKISVPSWMGKSKHKYKDDFLCLYYKCWENWNGKDAIATTIIPWISQWLLFNEFYKLTNNFAALEVQH